MHLNYLPLRFTSDVFRGGLLSFEGNAKDLSARDSALSLKLQELRQEHGKTHVFHASNNTIACIPVTSDAPAIGETKQFHIHTDFQLANALARSALFDFFKATGNETVIAFRPVTLLLEKHNLASARKDVFGLFPEYTLDVRPLAPHEGEITSGVLVGFGIHYAFLKTLADLFAEGVPLAGLYAVRLRGDETSSPFQRRYLGRIERIEQDAAILSDSDLDEFPAGQCYLEGSRTNIEAAGRALLGRAYDAFSQSLLKETFNVMGAEHQVQRLGALGTWLETKSPIQCAGGLSIRIHKTPHECPKGADAGFTHIFPAPKCVLRPGGSITVSWPVDKQIDLHGPYDAESFPDKRVKIAVICPEEFVGEAGQFLRKLRRGSMQLMRMRRSGKALCASIISMRPTLHFTR